MALSLSSLKSTKQQAQERAPVVMLYGVDGVGKTSLAAEAPNPIYIPTEGERAPSDVELPTPGTIKSLNDLWEIGGELLSSEHEFKTAIFDSVDGIEPLIWGATCQRIGVNSIEEAGYGKGYVEADVEWNQFLGLITALSEAGITPVLLAHPGIVTFNSPISDPYSRYEIKLHKRAAALTREKADVVGFINYRISLVKADPKKTNSHQHAEGGNERNIHLNEKAGFVAKNRFGMPDSIKYKKGEGWSALASYFPNKEAA